MFGKVLNFVKYNNAFTLIIVVCFLSAGVTFAASPTARDSIYSSEQTVVSEDNTAIVSTDLDGYGFNLKIDGITEDANDYFVAYSYQTLAVQDGVWQPQAVQKTLTVSKEALGTKDLGLYAQKELSDNMDYELSYLKRVQALEKAKGESQKVVSVTYSGLIGKLLNPHEEVIEGYTPVNPDKAPAEAQNPDKNANAAAVIVPILTPNNNPATTPPANPLSPIISNPPASTLASSSTPTSTPPAATSTSTSTSTPVTNPTATTTPPVDNPPAASSTPPVDPATTTPPSVTPPDNNPPPSTTTPPTTAPPTPDPVTPPADPGTEPAP